LAVIGNPDSSVMQLLKADLIPQAFQDPKQLSQKDKVCSPENKTQSCFSGSAKPLDLQID